MRVLAVIIVILATLQACTIPSRTIDDTTSMRSFDAVNHALADERVRVIFRDGTEKNGWLGEINAESAHFYVLGDQYSVTISTGEIHGLKERRGFPFLMIVGGLVAAGGAAMELTLLPRLIGDDDSVFFGGYTLIPAGVAIMLIGYRVSQPDVIYEIDHEHLGI